MLAFLSPLSRRYAAAPATLRGMVLILASTLCFTGMHAAIRHVTMAGDLHPFEAVFFRNLFGLLVLVPWIVRAGMAPLRTNQLRLHALRGVLQVIAMLAFFTALKLSPLALVSALSFSAPLFASMGAVLFLGERMRLRRWGALVIGFAGALVIVRPGVAELDAGTLSVLFAAALWASAMLVIKALARTDSSVTITAYMGLFLTPLSLVPALFVWHMPSLAQLAWLVLIGALGNLGHLSMAQAFREAEATAVLPLDFTRLIWAAAIGYLAFAEVPDLWTWVGGTVIFLSTTYIAFREARLRDEGRGGPSVGERAGEA